MSKLNNPHPADQNPCFGCSTNNPIGLHLNFEEEGDRVISKWLPGEHYQGYINVLHGGIQATLLDEVAAWVIYVKAETAGVTSRMNVTYQKPVYISKGEITIEGRLLKKEGKNALVECLLKDGSGEVCTRAELNYFVYPEKIARERFHYPGVENFRKG